MENLGNNSRPSATTMSYSAENTTSINDTNYFFGENDEDTDEVLRQVKVIGFGSLIILGTIGNGLTFVVMRRGSLRNVSTCFYMAMLSVADTDEYYVRALYLVLSGTLGRTRTHGKRPSK